MFSPLNITLRIRALKLRSNKSVAREAAGERRPIQKRKASLNLRAQYHIIDFTRDLARIEPEVSINDAFVVVL